MRWQQPIDEVHDVKTATRNDEVESLDGRFSFGENWLSFIETLDEGRIAEAERSLKALCGMENLHGKRFIDIGSGSGLSSLAARRLGATVFSFDYDPQSVAGTRKLKERFFPDDQSWQVGRGSALDSDYLASLGKFDIVYSWGVLHHTGAMNEAIVNAASCVDAGGMFVFALYRKTLLCPLWKIEKRWYANASEASQRAARAVFTGALRLAFRVRRRDFGAYVRDYRGTRGMNFEHDVHDWMGGYPYESISPKEAEFLMSRLNFQFVRSNLGSQSIGIFGSGCDEFVYRRPER
jgi:2-polyprenyl-6-hydroxyphenyl methylase/3-demethylubiquinone-9 3-methyltransferase